jgi:3-hydroxyacyl-CoA dehydrogenase
VNEGAKLLEEGIAYRSSDIDVVYCSGYGFPVHRGGPMQYADEVGLDNVVAALDRYKKALGEYGDIFYEPAPILKTLAAEGRTLKSYVPNKA